MKNKIIAVLLAFAFMLNLAKPYKLRAYADAMTASMLGSVAYSIMQASGISFTAGNATAAGMDSFMSGQIESYVNSKGGTLTSLFGGEMARLAAGKLVVGQQMYNGVLDFVDWLKEKYTLGETNKYIAVNGQGYEIDGAFGYTYTNLIDNGYWRFTLYTNSEQYSTRANVKEKDYPISTGVTISQQTSGNILFIHFRANYANDILTQLTTNQNLTGTVDLGTFPTLQANISDYTNPQPLPQDKQWEGDFSQTPGWAEPHDLPDFLSRVPTAIAENNLVVQEEITDTGGTPPTPSPNPSPSPSPVPYPGLSIAEKIALILGEITAIMFDTKGDTADQTYQDIGQEIEQTTQEIAESITQPITQTQTQTQQQIIDSTQTITQTITDTQTQTQEKLEDITQTIEDATSVPDQTSWDKVKKDLHGVFPFCIPWDIYGMLNAFNAEPRAPYFEYPFKIPSINLDYTLELDFKDFDPVAQTLRTVELIAFCVGLAILTSKVIRW